MSTTNMKSLPDDDPSKIFFRLENHIHSVVEYLAVLEATSRAELIDDVEKGAYRLILDLQDHANAIRDGFRTAFSFDRGAE
jgi:hypothetical protein